MYYEFRKFAFYRFYDSYLKLLFSSFFLVLVTDFQVNCQ